MPELGKVKRHSVPPGLATDLARWARGAEPGYLLRIAWSDASNGSSPVAHLVGADLVKGFRPLSPARQAIAASRAERVCELLTALLKPLVPLLERGVPREELAPARCLRPATVLDLIWRLENTPLRRVSTARARKAEAHTLEQAAAIVEKYRATLELQTPRVRIELADNRGAVRHWYPSGEQLRWLATSIRAVPAKAGKPAERRALVCARVLESILGREPGQPGASEIAAVVQAAWPGAYQSAPAGEGGGAARHLLARSRKAVSAELLARARASLSDEVARRLAALPASPPAVPPTCAPRPPKTAPTPPPASLLGKKKPSRKSTNP